MTGGGIHVGVEALELCGPGLANWNASRHVLAGARPYHPQPIVLDPPENLSPAERRRAIASVKLALAVGMGAVAQSGHDPKTLPAVFASSGPDSETNCAILSALMTPGREVSPTRFHNSVHNAPSGYWGIATQSREAVTSLSCHDFSFAAGLLEASVQAVFDARPVLLIAYDLPYPEPLCSARRIEAGFGVAFVLSPIGFGKTMAEFHIKLVAAPDGPVCQCVDPDLEALRRGNPAARSLPLLGRLAAGTTGQIRLALSQGALDVGVVAC